jgi:hypothetical protein
VIQNSGDQLRIIADRWRGRVEYVGVGYVVAIEDGELPNDDLRGYRTFAISGIAGIGDAYFVGTAKPRKPVAAARNRAAV